MKQRLDLYLTQAKQAPTRSQAESMIRLGDVQVNGRVVTKPGMFVSVQDKITLVDKQRYVSRAGLKLASVADVLRVDFSGKTVLDVGSSTGGFTDYALKQGALKVYAVDVGTNQLHPSLRTDTHISLHEKTDIRDFILSRNEMPDVILIDVSFISLREVLPHIKQHLSGPNTQIIAMVKPQFEAGQNMTHKGVIKNEATRRKILRQFEDWVKQDFVIRNKRDSEVKGEKGNTERFYLLSKLK